jgi:mRNA degradation ribonuclease J1/J2
MDIMYRKQEETLTATLPNHAEKIQNIQQKGENPTRTLADRSASAPHLFLERKKVCEWTQAGPEGVMESPATCCSDEKFSEKCITPSDRAKEVLGIETSTLPDKLFKIVNLDTGEAIDIRDENKDNFTFQFSKITSQNYLNLKEYL